MMEEEWEEQTEEEEFQEQPEEQMEEQPHPLMQEQQHWTYVLCNSQCFRNFPKENY